MMILLVKCEWTVLQSEELDLTKSIPELPDAAPDTSVYPDPEQPQQGTSKIKKAYCEPCWLFANPASKNTKCLDGGYDDWKHIVDAIERHETSKIHLDSCLINSGGYKRKIFWRQVLSRLLEVTLILSTCNLAFRGHREKADSNDPSSLGNF
ncbi:hypothetical protein EVAR_63352_1 [Eumeta japonica]|uniref:DUF4371 domain-containing protein n=1 Tax=Eumeta variegata TaxID=151549 RepID=A0A4C2AEX6_EUMVA|nr:hypothetical protein EVAR_63352_1 [Eumeta japonica]